MIIKKTIFYLIGNLLIALGISTLIYANLGTGAWSAFYVGLYKHFGLTIGTWSIIISCLLIAINAMVSKKKPDSIKGFFY